jgi:hypothetical protein
MVIFRKLMKPVVYQFLLRAVTDLSKKFIQKHFQVKFGEIIYLAQLFNSLYVC